MTAEVDLTGLMRPCGWYSRLIPLAELGTGRPGRAVKCLVRVLIVLASSGLLAGQAQAQPVISEFMADNSRTLNDEDGDSSDWLEIYNPAPTSLNLAGWHLTDTTNLLTKWSFPDVSLGPNSYLVVFASEKNRTTPGAPLHTNFRLSDDGEYLALVDPGGQVVSDFFPAFPAQQKDISYGRDRVDPSVLGYFGTATPGGHNSTSGAGLAPGVQFSRVSGAFSLAFTLELTLDRPEANTVIHYTVDGSFPTPASPVFSGAIPITNSVQVRARAFAAGRLPGPPRSEMYFALDESVAAFTSELPVVLLHTMGGGAPAADGELFVAMAVFEPRPGGVSLLESPALVTRARFNTRGNTTADYPKKSWNFEAWDEFDVDRQIPLLGLPADSDWVFYAPNNVEPVMLHNPLIHELSRRIGRYSPRTRFVEVYINVTGGMVRGGHYNGIYVIEEKIKIAPERVAIDELELENVQPPAVTGGYLVKCDFKDGHLGEVGMLVAGRELLFVEPREQEIHLPIWQAQKLYLSNYFQSFYSALTGPNFQHPELGYAAYIDTGSWIDHHLLQVLSKNIDALGLSEFFHKPRGGPIVSGPLWDFDRAFFSTDGRDTDPGVGRSMFGMAANFWPGPWWNRLFNDPDFFQKWIDRYQALRRGALATHQVQALVDKLAAEVTEAQPREEARWGTYARPRGGYANEVNTLKNWLADRMYFMDTNFLSVPRLSHEGGGVAPGFTVSMLVPAGATGYYTLDGSDPRAAGGGVSPQAQIYTSAIAIHANARLVARAYKEGHRNLTGTQNPPLTSPWSGPSEATFIVSPLALVVTEIMYHPSPSPGGDITEAERFEYVELKNVGPTPLGLGGVRFTNGIDFAFTGSAITQLGPGQSVLIVKDRAAFVSRYGERANIAGEFAGQLDNGGERLRLEGPSRETLMDFSYRDSWYRVTDGFGFSLVLRDEQAAPATWSERNAWRPSVHRGGSPGQPEPTVSGLPGVILNEILPRPAVGSAAIEIWNPTANAADLSHWCLSNDREVPAKYRFPVGTVLSPGEFRVVTENAFNAPGDPNRFGFTSQAGEVWLFSADSLGVLTGYEHQLQFGAAAPGTSFGRLVDSTGREHFPPSASATLGAANAGARVGPVVITEVMYHPPDRLVRATQLDDGLDEYIELRNVTGELVKFAGESSQAWRLRGAVEFEFPADFTLAAGAYAIVVGFRPEDEVRQSSFRTRYAVPATVPILGPYDGKLDNSGERVELAEPIAIGEAGEVHPIPMDQVEYSDGAPWPSAADGTGLSLHRASELAFGNDPANWRAASPSPGRGFPAGTPPSIMVQPADAHVLIGRAPTFQVVAQGSGRLGYHWQFNGASIFGATNATLGLTGVQPQQAGEYSVVVFNEAGAVLSRAARLSVAPGPMITHGPINRSVQPGANVTNTVVASGVGLLRYQWLLNGLPVDGATNATLVLTNVGLDQIGKYEVLLTDDVGSITTRPANLLVLIRPVITQQPQPALQTALEGDTVTFTVAATPIHPSLPLSYQWRREGTPIAGQTNTTLRFTLTNVISPAGALETLNRFSVLVANAALSALSANAAVLVLADSDRDRMADAWENAYGFNRNNPSDAALDADGDGLSNVEEFIAGTHPTNRLSRLVLRQLREPLGGRTLQLDAISNKTYSVQWREGIERGQWQTLTNMSSRPSNWLATVLDPWPAAQGRIYRLATPQTGPAAPGPLLLASPMAQAVRVGNAVVWSVIAVGNEPLTYQWLFNGLPLVGKTGSSLNLGPVSPGQQGVYAVVVTDAFGVSIASTPAVLTVLPQP